MKHLLLFLLLPLCLTVLTACGGQAVLEGRCLVTDDRVLLLPEEGDPLVLSDESAGGGLFAGLQTGDLLRITHGAVAESWPGQTDVSACERLSSGTPADLPADTMDALAELGYAPADEHSLSTVDNTVAHEAVGYCGNMVTAVAYAGGKDAGWETSFWGGDSVALTDLLTYLDYSEPTCRCLPEYTVDTELGGSYGVNLTAGYARCGDGQVSLTAEQAQTLADIFARCAPED